MVFYSELNASPGEVLKHMGYPEGKTAPTKIMDRLMGHLDKAGLHFKPVVYFDEFSIESDPVAADNDALGKGLTFQSKFVCDALKNCSAAILGVATIEKSTESARSTQPTVSDQLILESIENAALETLAADFWNHLAAESRASKATGLTRLYLPGEKDWPISDQKPLFSMLTAREPALSVKLNESFMMDPEKSLSFVIGRTKDGTFSEVHHDCALCQLESCSLRKKPQPPAQHRLVVHDISGSHEFYVKDGQNLLSAVLDQGYKVEGACGGNKTCGKCRAKIEKGSSPEPTSEEEVLRQSQNMDLEERLLCFIDVDRDLEITLTNQHLKPQIMVEGFNVETGEIDPWVMETIINVAPAEIKDQSGLLKEMLTLVPGADSISLNALTKASTLVSGKDQQLVATTLDHKIVGIRSSESPASKTCGAAIDIGTTTLAAYLHHYASDEILATESALNPQFVRGKDVMTRIHYVSTNVSGARELSALLVQEINRLLSGLAHKAGIDTTDILHVVATGNTTMLHLLLGVNCALMGVSPFVPVFTEPLTLPAVELGLNLHVDGLLTVLPSKAAFVGADLLSAAFAAGVHRQTKDQVQLLIDIGTNGEIVLAGKGRMLCCATAAGPAFEGGSISCGMGGVDGAIDKVNFSWPHRFTTLGGSAAKGICGSGLIDLCAELLRYGKLSQQGRLLERDENDRFFLDKDSGVFISQKDIREVQLAKGAIHAAVELLMGQLGIGPEEIDQVLLAGGFGSFLNLESAEEIKLLPAGLMVKAQIIGNAAGMGAVAALRSKGVLREINEIKARMEYVELSGSAEFQTAFIMKLGF
ncbi:MAG: DUF4445 domain-containing protein [Acidaminobacter sp.]|uniref:ASKHA domain-containing protein n=1 Tax=Acidaminobacter sp. TaxID=1872102 RepID=UPI0013802028|nr:ASKHA domain-containing protein [Acidaminobacter sp.]MZQ98941.1 DUF4445 domain-containing protein [Acidaminobacter sp.]